MDLFNDTHETNLLPYDGEVIYYGIILPLEQANRYASLLMDTIAWKHDEALIYGKRIITARKVAWYADREFSYTYSGTTKQALPWTKELSELKKIAEEKSGHRFNSCLLNLYHHGEEGMAWHSDDESSLGKNTVIASISFGAERKFAFKHKQSKDSVSLILEHGSLLVMKGATQSNWLHRLPPTAKVKRPRINLTFRTIIDQG